MIMSHRRLQRHEAESQNALKKEVGHTLSAYRQDIDE